MAQSPVKLHAAGSLRGVMMDIATAFQKARGVTVVPTYGASGSLKERIEKGEATDVFTSANMEHPEALHRAGRSGAVVRFTRNQMCALTVPAVSAAPATLLDVLLTPGITVGTSTPKFDPSGDYAWEIFRKAEAVRPGSYAVLDAKALKLTGYPGAPQPPAGRNAYGWVLEQKQADVFLTYCTNAAVAVKEVSGLKRVALPEALTVGADYGMTVMNGASPAAHELATFILAPEGQAILAAHGFDRMGGSRR